MRTDDFFQDSYTRKFIKYQATDAQKKYLGQAIKIHDYCEMSILFDYTDDVHYDLLTSALAEIAETDEKFMTRLENALSVVVPATFQCVWRLSDSSWQADYDLCGPTGSDLFIHSNT